MERKEEGGESIDTVIAHSLTRAARKKKREGEKKGKGGRERQRDHYRI